MQDIETSSQQPILPVLQAQSMFSPPEEKLINNNHNNDSNPLNAQSTEPSDSRCSPSKDPILSSIETNDIIKSSAIVEETVEESVPIIEENIIIDETNEIRPFEGKNPSTMKRWVTMQVGKLSQIVEDHCNSKPEEEDTPKITFSSQHLEIIRKQADDDIIENAMEQYIDALIEIYKGDTQLTAKIEIFWEHYKKCLTDLKGKLLLAKRIKEQELEETKNGDSLSQASHHSSAKSSPRKHKPKISKALEKQIEKIKLQNDEYYESTVTQIPDWENKNKIDVPDLFKKLKEEQKKQQKEEREAKKAASQPKNIKPPEPTLASTRSRRSASKKAEEQPQTTTTTEIIPEKPKPKKRKSKKELLAEQQREEQERIRAEEEELNRVRANRGEIAWQWQEASVEFNEILGGLSQEQMVILIKLVSIRHPGCVKFGEDGLQMNLIGLGFPESLELEHRVSKVNMMVAELRGMQIIKEIIEQIKEKY